MARAYVLAVVIAGAGKAFCAGHDLKEMRAAPSLGYYQRLFAQCGRMMMAIQKLPVRFALDRAGLAHEGGEIRRQRRQRELVDRPVPVVVPRPERRQHETGRLQRGISHRFPRYH